MRDAGRVFDGGMSRFLRFGMVGAINTGVYFGLYLLLRQACFYLVAHIVAFLLAMVASYFLNCVFTFRTRPTLRKFLLFPLSNVVSLAVQTVGLSVLVGAAGMNAKYAPLPAAVVAVPVTFLIARVILADRRGSAPGPAAEAGPDLRRWAASRRR